MIEFVHVGYSSYIKRSLIVSVTHSANNLTERTERAILQDEGLLFDMTHGRRAKSVISLNTGHLVLSAQSPEEIKWRML